MHTVVESGNLVSKHQIQSDLSVENELLLLFFLTFSALVANPKKTTLHGGQSRSWSAEQGKKKKKKKPGSAPPPPPPPVRAARSEKNEIK